MKLHPLQVLVPGVVAAAALALALGAGAQTTPPPGTPPASPMAGHHMGSTAEPAQATDMKAQCQAMMAKKQEAQEKRQAMDAALDKLVAEMNAAQASKAPDAMEKPMAAVINELVAQRKAMHAMMMEMQPAMMSHMMHHMEMQGAKGMMECPMMPKAEDKKPTM